MSPFEYAIKAEEDRIEAAKWDVLTEEVQQ